MRQSWSGGLNDGKLRIPIGGVTSIPPGLERVLRHELTQSFVHSIGGPQCPVWLQEGLAQLMEPRSSSMYANELGPLFLERKAIPFSVLEHPFTRFSALQAQVAYAESLAAVEYLRGRYGMGEIVRMLESIARRSRPPETAPPTMRVPTYVLPRKGRGWRRCEHTRSVRHRPSRRTPSGTNSRPNLRKKRRSPCRSRNSRPI